MTDGMHIDVPRAFSTARSPFRQRSRRLSRLSLAVAMALHVGAAHPVLCQQCDRRTKGNAGAAFAQQFNALPGILTTCQALLQRS